MTSKRIQPVPAIATWLVKFFCSSAEDESMIGDLLEKYRQGRSRFWYRRQVAGIVFLRLGRMLRHLGRAAMAMPLRNVLNLLLIAAAVSAVLMTDIWIILFIAIFGGIIAGAAIILLGNRAADRGNAESLLSRHPGISMHHIPVEGAVGLLFVFATVFVFGVGVPAIREILVLIAPLAGLAFGILAYWHKGHSVKIESLNLHKQ